jgi:hypothetical protein
MEGKIDREDIEKILKEIKIRISSENEFLEVIEKHPIPALLVAFSAGVVLSQIDDLFFEKVKKGEGSSPFIDGIIKVGLPLIMKKFM